MDTRKKTVYSLLFVIGEYVETRVLYATPFAII